MGEALYKGGCACGGVKLSIEAEPAGPYQCCCRQCRQASGGQPATFVIAPRDKVRIEGETARYVAATDSGRRPTRTFCPTCGTALYSELEGAPQSLVVKLSAIENAPWVDVKAIFWTREAPAWLRLDPLTPAFETQP